MESVRNPKKNYEVKETLPKSQFSLPWACFYWLIDSVDKRWIEYEKKIALTTHYFLDSVCYINIFLLKYISSVSSVNKGFFHIYKVNPADSKIRVYRQDPEDWYEGQHNISWDTDAVELENTDTVDIFLFSLIVRVVYSLNCFQFVAGCHCYLQIFLTFGNTENFVVIFTGGSRWSPFMDKWTFARRGATFSRMGTDFVGNTRIRSCYKGYICNGSNWPVILI